MLVGVHVKELGYDTIRNKQAAWWTGWLSLALGSDYRNKFRTNDMEEKLVKFGKCLMWR